MSAFTDLIIAQGFVEKDVNDMTVTDTDYNAGWHGLTVNNPAIVFKKDDKSIVLRLSYRPGGPDKIIRIYDDSDNPSAPLYESKTGQEPDAAFLDNYFIS